MENNRRKKVLGPPPEGHVVKDFYIGNTHIKICDDSCRDKTPEQVQEILDRISKLVSGPYIMAQEEKARKAAEAAAAEAV